MFEVTFIYGVILACLYVFKILSNDPEKEKIWGPGASQSQFTKIEKEIETLKSQLEHYKAFRPTFADEQSREESMA